MPPQAKQPKKDIVQKGNKMSVRSKGAAQPKKSLIKKIGGVFKLWQR